MKHWQPDRLLPGFEALELDFPADYDGPVVSTLLRLAAANAPRGAVLYIHGFSDYFFQRHMAERFAAEGYAFYALDLRKYGRSLRPNQHGNFCKSLSEYYDDISAALDVIGGEVLLAGHSMGGLVASLYAHEGARRSATLLRSCTAGWRSSAPCCRCIRTRPMSCSTGGTSRAGRACSAPTSPSWRSRALGTTSSCRRAASARKCSASSSPGRHES